MIVRKASSLDKNPVLDFCKSTFSWGDYISEVWDFWIKEGELLVSEDAGVPVGICHVYFGDNFSWIEGIRVQKNFRKLGIGSTLIKSAEFESIKNAISDIYMLIEVNNSSSLSLAKKENYDILQTWNFYTLNPDKHNNSSAKIITSYSDISKIIPKSQFYVDSWRWCPLSDKSLRKLIDDKKVLYSKNNGNVSIGFLIDSKHFQMTKILTIFGTGKSLEDLLNLVQNICFKENIQRIQVLTPHILPLINGLEKRMQFHLMHKKLKTRLL